MGKTLQILNVYEAIQFGIKTRNKSLFLCIVEMLRVNKGNLKFPVSLTRFQILQY